MNPQSQIDPPCKTRFRIVKNELSRLRLSNTWNQASMVGQLMFAFEGEDDDLKLWGAYIEPLVLSMLSHSQIKLVTYTFSTKHQNSLIQGGRSSKTPKVYPFICMR
jgi:hypothetical protein